MGYERFARVLAPLRAAALRFAALRLRVRAAFLAASLQLEPPTRFSSSSAAARRFLTVRVTIFGCLP